MTDLAYFAFRRRRLYLHGSRPHLYPGGLGAWKCMGAGIEATAPTKKGAYDAWKARLNASRTTREGPLLRAAAWPR